MNDFNGVPFEGPIPAWQANRVSSERIWERAWEHEDGGGYTILGTHDPFRAHKAIFDRLIYDLYPTDWETIGELLPEFEDVGNGERLWIRRADIWEENWKTYTRWAPGRVRVLVVSV